MTKHNQMRLLRQCAILFAKMRTSNCANVFVWIRIVFTAHRLGYLYCGFNEKGNIDQAVIAYRVKRINEDSRSLPLKEQGNILFVCCAASVAKDVLKLRRLMRWYLKNNLEVSQIAYDYRNGEGFRIHNLRRKHGGPLKSVTSNTA